MQKIVAYKVIYAKDNATYASFKSVTQQNCDALNKRIKTHIKAGWQPFGGVSIATSGKNSDTLVFAQAMVSDKPMDE